MKRSFAASDLFLALIFAVIFAAPSSAAEFDNIKTAAERGTAMSQFMLADMYERGTAWRRT